MAETDGPSLAEDLATLVRKHEGHDARLRVGLPSRGRLHAGSLELLYEAGLQPDLPADRALAFQCRNAPIDVLLVRSGDIPEYVQDGVVDCGITGLDRVRESGAEVAELLRLRYGSCTLQTAVPDSSPVDRLEDLAGARIATAYPRLTHELLARRGVEAELVTLAGSVELAPRLGLADAITDLVATGETLRRNGLRSVAILFESEAVLVAPRRHNRQTTHLASFLEGVIEARSMRHVVCYVPPAAVARMRSVLSGTRWSAVAAGGANDDGIYIHLVVHARDLWDLLPRVRACGAGEITIAHGSVAAPAVF